LYIVSILLPRLLKALIAAMEIKVATSAYSIALAPFSQWRNFVNPRIAHSRLTLMADAATGSAVFLSRRLSNACGIWLTPPCRSADFRMNR
jgi:hypothetical protein